MLRRCVEATPTLSLVVCSSNGGLHLAQSSRDRTERNSKVGSCDDCVLCHHLVI